MALAAALSSGCARGLNDTPPPTEQLLAATGFQMRAADSPERWRQLEAMTQQRLVVHPANGDERYVYADVELCRCLYAGTAEAYARYRRLAWYRRVAGEQRDAVARSPDERLDWALWGPWDPWY